VIHTQRGDHDPLCGDAESPGHLLCHRVARGADDRRTGRGSLDQIGQIALRRGQKVGAVQERQVVHCDDAGARFDGGSTKFVACSTSASPASSSVGGQSTHCHNARSARAGTGPPCTATPLGTTPRSAIWPRAVKAVTMTSTSDRVASSRNNAAV
jgi:hypothetical protein